MPAISFTAGELACPGIGADDTDGLTALVNQYDSDFYASSTTASMTSAMRKFWAFLSRHRLWHLDPHGRPISVPPLLAVHIMSHVGFLIWSGIQISRQGKRQTFTSHDSITKHCATLRTWCRTNGRPDPGIDTNTGAPRHAPQSGGLRVAPPSAGLCRSMPSALSSWASACEFSFLEQSSRTRSPAS